LTTQKGEDELTMVAQDTAAAAAFKSGDLGNAKATLKDGRVLALSTLVATPRPSVKLLGKSVELSSSSNDSNIQLNNQDELPQDARLTFSVRTVSPASFAFDEKIEVATADESFSATLTMSNGGVTLENSKVAVARLDPAKAFGPSAFGPLQFRVISNGVPGDWQRLATLVRLPLLKDLKCPATADLACKLSGANLFLVDSVSSDPKFTHPVQVPDGFPGYSMPVPHPTDGNLYVKLRDDPTVVNLTMLGAQQLPPTVEETARAVERHAAHAEPEAAPAVQPSQGGTKSTVLSSSSSGENPPPPPVASPPPPTGAAVQQATAPVVTAQPTPTMAAQAPIAPKVTPAAVAEQAAGPGQDATSSPPTSAAQAAPAASTGPAAQAAPAAAQPPVSQQPTPSAQTSSTHGAAVSAPGQRPAG
jgi:hypothetical protein